MSDLPVYWHKSCDLSFIIMMMRTITLVTLLLLMIAESTAQASFQSSPDNRGQTCCSDGHGLNYTLPMFRPCITTQREDGSTVVTIPKLIPASSLDDTQCRRKNKNGIPPGRRVCRLPVCFPTPCKNGGTCQQIVTSFSCTCPDKFYGPVCGCECPVFYTPDGGDTREYIFPGFWIAENVTSFDFMVSADHNAFIGLFASNVSDERYELIIGGWSNTGGALRRVASSDYSTALVPQSINPDSFSLSRIPDFDHYQLSFANGHIKLSRYGTQLDLMNATDPDPLPVNYVGIWTGYGSIGYWKFPTFCQESQKPCISDG